MDEVLRDAKQQEVGTGAAADEGKCEQNSGGDTGDGEAECCDEHRTYQYETRVSDRSDLAATLAGLGENPEVAR